MQLFVTDYQKKGETVIMNNPDLLSQIRKVLRASIGDIIWIQSPKNELKKTRYELRIEVWDNETLEGTILSEQIHESTPETKGMIIAMPNKWDKVELIAQKLTECGINEIIFRPSERSVIKERNSKKEERLQKIIKEAVEQSRGRTVPELRFTTIPKDIIGNHPLVIFDKIGAGNKEQEAKTGNLKPVTCNHIVGLIGPEGGLTPRDYKIFEGTKYNIYELGETVLRTETAAIVGGRLLKNTI